MNQHFHCIIVDDEQDAIELLAARLKVLFHNIEITGSYTLWHEALKAIQTLSVDIIFMDISMPGKSGINLLRLVPETRAEIIFITAHDEYALNAFEFSTSGYILKPIDDLELSQAVERAMKRIRNKSKDTHVNSMHIGIPDSHGINYVDIRDIQYLESINGYTNVVTSKGNILTSFNLAKFKHVVDSTLFYQVHRSFIVNISAIRRYKSSGVVVMHDDKEIPVAKSVRAAFLSLFNLVSKG
jgi:two-component system LytT family response regulator